MDEPAQVVSATPIRSVAVIRRVAGPLMSVLGITAVLEVPGRRTGTPQRVSLAPIQIDGTWYLLSLYGATGWVHNLRAAGRATLHRRGRMQAFTATEVDGTERDRVIARFHRRSPGPFSRDFDRRPGAAEHPAFRVEPIA